MRVLHLPNSIAGNPWGLSQAERKIGLESRVLCLDPNIYKHNADFIIDFPKNKTFFRKQKILIRSLKAFLRIRAAFDVFHFNYGSSLLDFPKYGIYAWDLPFYPSQAKLFVTYNGCDARQKFPTIERNVISACNNPLCNGGICNSGEQDMIRRKRIAKFSKYTEHIFAVNPDLLWFLPKEKTSFLPYTVASWFDDMTPLFPFSQKKLRIVHAPTNRECKGSNIILKALRKLEEYFPEEIEIILVEGKTHSEALSIYREADLIVDQILVGWYGGLAVEVMKMGKPVAVFIREEDLHFIPKEMRKDIDDAFIRIRPDTIDEVLGCFTTNRKLLREKGENGYQYVRKWHDPLKIALQIKEYYEGKR